MQYPDAIIIAENIRQQLAPHCEPQRCFIAGSIRRKKADIGDVEIVCLPKKEQVKDLFENVIATSCSLSFKKTINEFGKWIKGTTDGRMMQIELPYDGLMLDLFMPQPKDFFRQLVIRTGSREYSQHIIATGWRKLGWVGTTDGLRLQEQCVETFVSDKSKWKCAVSNPTLPPAWQDEREFFDWLGVPFLVPEKRF